MIDVKLFEKTPETITPNLVGEVEYRVFVQLKELEKSQSFFGDGVVALVTLLAKEIDNLRAEIEAKGDGK